MKFHGQLRKMTTQNGKPIQYYLSLDDDLLHMNELIDKTIAVEHTGYQCVQCQNDEPIYRMGFCKKCFFESPYASESIIRPELSKAHLGEEERNLEIEQQIQLVPHVVYLAYTGDVKVGVTRQHQVPTRWIDQGATFALPIAKTNNRYEAGQIEVALKEHISDKTNYRKMLADEYEDDLDLVDFRNSIEEFIPKESKSFYINEEDIVRLDYPYQAPDKIKSTTLDKNPIFKGKLTGIKGQYLSFEDGTVFNVRSHEGYVINLEIL